MDEIVFAYSRVAEVFPELLADIEYDGQLSATAYIILAVVLFGIIGGLGWCFYRAVTAGDKPAEPQSPDEVGDKKQQC